MRNYKHKLRGIALSLFMLFCFFQPSLSSDASLTAAPFKVPEKFIYDLTWTGIKAGTASLESVNDGNTFRIISTARSADWISVFYTVDDRIESTLFRNAEKSAIGQPYSYRIKIREGRHRRDKEVLFDQDAKKATYIDHLKKERKEYPARSGVRSDIKFFLCTVAQTGRRRAGPCDYLRQ